MIRCSINQVVCALAMASLLLGSIAQAQETTPPVKRAAVPALTAQNDARKLLGNLFRAEFEQAKKAEEKAALAEKMLQVGRETNDDAAGQYMLFQIAKEIAIGASIADVALKAIDAQGVAFEINVPEAKLDTVTAIEKNLKFSKDRQALLTTLDQLVEEFQQAGRYDLAKKGVTLSIDLARKIPDANAIKQATARLKDIDSREKLFGEVQAARQVLATKPDDPAANLTVGRALCLIHGDWEHGLPHLAKSGDAKLKAIAEQELAQPQAAEKQMALADSWWDLSEKEAGSLQSAMQQRAVAWYQTALPQLTGLAKLKVTGRIEKAGGKPGEGTTIAAVGSGKSTATAPKPTQKLITNGIGMKLVLIPAGTFLMGSHEEEKGHGEKETQHRVKLTKSYYIGMMEVTQGQWTAVMGTKPWEGRSNVREGANYAASYISWADATEFCRKLSENEGKTYRLPTEAEWEYACRAGTTGPYHFPPETKLGDFAWFGISNKAEEGYAHEVGQKLPNAAGLHDMQGNAREWCSDWYADYPNGDATDPRGPDSGTIRVIRGGSWGSKADGCRSATRYAFPKQVLEPYQGFRVVCELQAAATTPSTPISTSSPASSGPKPAVPSGSGLTKNQNNKEITNGIGMTLALIPAGTFMMGSPPEEEGRQKVETQHRVTISKPFYMGATEVTQGQWAAVMGTKPWEGKDLAREDANHAATHITWDDAAEFCRKLSTKEKARYRLPTEAEWEYACRAGTTSIFHFGDDASQLAEYDWCNKNTIREGERYAHAVAQKKPNAFGLYDMHGNVREWCGDWYNEKYYLQSPASDPQGPPSAVHRVVRGGSWSGSTDSSRSAVRGDVVPSTSNHAVGFRVVRQP